MKLKSLPLRRKLCVGLVERWRIKNPNPRCELFYKTPYQLLVSVVLSAQTTDKSVNKVMQPLYEKKFDPRSVIKLGREGFQTKIKSIGLAPTKAKNVLNLTKMLIDQHGSQVPQTREELEALPGVGRKTANVILGELYGQPTIAVDTHVFRVGRRLGLHAEKTPEKAEQELLKIIDPASLPAAHHWFILHGRYTCKAAKPLCNECTVNDLCRSEDKI